jgi:hypothetical protein
VSSRLLGLTAASPPTQYLPLVHKTHSPSWFTARPGAQSAGSSSGIRSRSITKMSRDALVQDDNIFILYSTMIVNSGLAVMRSRCGSRKAVEVATMIN